MSIQHALIHLFPGAIYVVHTGSSSSKYVVKELALQIQHPVATLASCINTVVKVFPEINTLVQQQHLWASRKFSLSQSNAELHIKYGWATISTIVSGFKEIRQGEPPKISKYQNVISDNYASPFLRFSLTKSAGPLLKEKADLVLHKLKEKLASSVNTTEGTYAQSLLTRWHRTFGDCAPAEGCASVCLHTLMHQLRLVAPLHLLSALDVKDTSMSPGSAVAYLVDSVEGGTGIYKHICKSL